MSRKRLNSGIEELLVSDAVLAPDGQVVEHELGDEVVLYDPRNDNTHVLNETAAIAWWLCDGQRTVAEIKADYASLCNVEFSLGARDVEEVLGNFLVSGLAKLESVPTSA
jgi:hypothetical protein